MSDEPVIDVKKHIAYWRDGALESWKDAVYLIKGKRIMLGLFAAHLALEKAIKAHIVRKTKQQPPKIHNLIRLSEIAGLEVSTQHKKVLAEINDFNLEGRYPDARPSLISKKDADFYMKRTKGTLEWLISQL